MLIEPTVLIIILAFLSLFSMSTPLAVPLFILNIILIIYFFKKIKQKISHHELAFQFAAAITVSVIFVLYDSGTSVFIRAFASLGIIELAQFLIMTYLMSMIIKSVYTLIYPKSKGINSHAVHSEHH